MRRDFNFNPHIIVSQPRHANTRPNRLVVGHILSQIPNHCVQRLIVERKVVRVNAIHLTPSLTTRCFQGKLDIRKSLVNLSVDFGVDL